MVTKIRSIKVTVEVDTNVATHRKEYDVLKYEDINELLADIEGEIAYWGSQEGT